MSEGPLRLVIRSPGGDRVLARPNGLAGWALPVIAAERPFLQWDSRTSSRAGAAVGAPVAPVRRLAPDVWEAEALERIPAAGASWIGLEDVQRLGSDAAATRDALERPPDATGHLRPGWSADLDAWADARFARTGPSTLLCHWELSAVISVPTAEGTVVVKQNGPGFTREGRVVEALAGVPHAPSVLAVDGDVLATVWAGEADADPVSLATALGQLHRAATERVPALRAADCPDATRLALTAAPHRLDDHVAAVDALDLPTSVVHADAHPGNARRDTDGTITVIDWSDAVVGSPVLDLPMLVLTGPHPDPGVEDRVIRGWAEGFGTDAGPVRARFGSIRAVAYAVTLALYDAHPDVPASARWFWDEWASGWRDRLDRSLAR